MIRRRVNGYRYSAVSRFGSVGVCSRGDEEKILSHISDSVRAGRLAGEPDTRADRSLMESLIISKIDLVQGSSVHRTIFISNIEVNVY